MKSFLHKLFLSLSALFIISGCAALRNSSNPLTSIIKASVDLKNISDDKVLITITPTPINSDKINFYIPQIVPGTYEYSNFGRFVENVQAFDNKGKVLPIKSIDQNTWEISNAKKLIKVTYLANDTFDGPYGKEIYPMGGTNFDKDNTFLLNLHSMIGYFEGLKEISYELKITSPKSLSPYTSLPIISKSDTLDIFNAKRYFHIIDNPILYTEPNSITFDLDNIKVRLVIHSPSNNHKAEDYQSAMQKMMIAQKKFLGNANKTPTYNILLHLMGMKDLRYFGGMMGALEHHTSTTVVFVDQMQPGELTQSLIDVVSHEFFHTLTPLNIHSEEIHNFEYNTPLMSKHLWMYEGTTEYFADLFQINQGLIDPANFYNRLTQKIDRSQRFDDTMSFTEMSSKIVDEPYQSNYANVYQKGALINMCLDILIRELSDGEKGILSVMKSLANRYGEDKPFKDDDLINEIVSLTYSEVDDFFKTHVEGNTPIDYLKYLSKVGLTLGETLSPVPGGILFQSPQLPFFEMMENELGVNQYVVSGLNSTLEKIGVKTGDVFLGLDGKMLPEIKKENLEEISSVLNDTFMWDADKEFSISIKRNEEALTLSGKVGTPSALLKGVIEDSNASNEAISLRNFWMLK